LDLEADDWRKSPIAYFRLDQLQQVVGILFVALGICVASYTKQLAGDDFQAWKEHIKRVSHHIF